MKVNAIVCPKCGDTIFSRTRHDYRSCSCGNLAIDGGFDYIKICGDIDHYKSKVINVKATLKQLLDDWNLSKNEFGLIKKKEKKND